MQLTLHSQLPELLECVLATMQCGQGIRKGGTEGDKGTKWGRRSPSQSGIYKITHFSKEIIFHHAWSWLHSVNPPPHCSLASLSLSDRAWRPFACVEHVLSHAGGGDGWELLAAREAGGCCIGNFSFHQSFLGKPGCSFLTNLDLKVQAPDCLIFWVLREFQIPAVGHMSIETLCSI